MRHSRKATPLSKPDKPYNGFPLFRHASGQWAKKINKRLCYFGTDSDAALVRLNLEYPYLKEGKTPPIIDVSHGCTVKALVNEFLHSKDDKLKAGDLSPRTFRDYYKTCEMLVDHFGRERRVADLRPDDFRNYRSKLAKRFGVVSLKNEINRTCIVFNYAHENNLIDKPVGYGQNFDRPSAKALRRDRNEAGAKLFERREVIAILDALDGKPVHVQGLEEPVQVPPAPTMKSMVLLGLNCGFGNSDCANLPLSAFDQKAGWVNFPRPKTEIPRRIPLWSETIAALSELLANRPDPADAPASKLVFLTRQGRPWVRVKQKSKSENADAREEPRPVVSVPIDAISGRFAKLLHLLRINGRRGLGFYTLRHCFETYAGESKDQIAVDAIMGHVDSSMAGNYRHRISDDRLRSVVTVVHNWLFGE
jgi:integrase